MPAGSGERAARWVEEVNDRRFIESLLAMDPAKAADLARREHSACTVGGAIAAMGFAAAMGVTQGVLLEYCTSRQVHPSDSFVGYAAVLYRRPAAAQKR
jgi:AmmeMemoRadiSam system protein B